MSVTKFPTADVIEHPYKDYRPGSDRLFSQLCEVVAAAEDVTYYEIVGALHEVIRLLPEWYEIGVELVEK